MDIMPNGFIEMTEIEKKNLVDTMEKEFKLSENHVRTVRRRWFLTDRYLEGVQWASTDAGVTGYLSSAFLSNFSVDLTNPDEKFIVDNIMLRIHMTNNSRLTRYEPQLEISPNESSDRHKIAARKGQIALYDLLEKNRFDKVKLANADDLNRYGKTFLWVTFDPSAGDPVLKPKVDGLGNVVEDPETGEPVMEMKPQGMVVLTPVSCKNMAFPADADNEDTADWIQKTEIRSPDFVKRKWDTAVKPETISSQDTSLEGAYTSDFSTEKARNDPDRVNVKERWYRPCEQFPKGAIITWANGVLLQCKTLTKWYPDIPCFGAVNIMVPGSPWGDTPEYHLVVHQNEVNKSESNVSRHVELVSKPKLLVNRAANISEKAFNNETGEIIEWSGDPAHKPEWLHPPEVSQSVYEHINRHVDRMMSIGYAHDINRAAHSQSGTSIAYLQEIDETTMQPMVMSMSSMYQRAMVMALRLMARYYTVPRLVKMFDNNSWQVEGEFKGDDLFGNFDVRVNMLAGLPANKLARQQFVMQMFQGGLIDQPTAQKYLELGEAEEALRAAAIEIEVAEANIKMIEAGQIVPVHDWDNHPILLQEYQKSCRQHWREYPPQVLAVFQQQMQMHQEFMALAAHPANAQDGGRPPIAFPGAGGPPGPAGPGAGPAGPAGAAPRNLATPNESPVPPGMPGQPGNNQPPPASLIQSHSPGRM